MNDDSRVIVAYNLFRAGCSSAPPTWEMLDDWQRDAMRVSYLQGILDQPDAQKSASPDPVTVEACAKVADEKYADTSRHVLYRIAAASIANDIRALIGQLGSAEATAVNTLQPIFDAIAGSTYIDKDTDGFASIVINADAFVRIFNNHRDRSLCTSI
jgi:hypothetical protein